MRELAARFLATLEPELAPATVGEYDHYLQVFFRFCQQHQVSQLRELRESHLVAYLQGLKGSSVTRGKHLQRVLAFLAWARERGLVLEDFAGVPRPRQRNQLPCVLSVERVRQLLEAPDLATPLGLRDRLLLELLYVLGLRRAEAEALELEHLDLASRQVLIHGKGGRCRRLPLSRGLLASLRAYLERGRPALAAPGETALLVSSRSGGRLSLISLYAIVKRRGLEVGLKVHPHQLRHACAVHLLEAGADYRFIQELLGHRCATTTGRYARARYLGLRQEFLRCHPRARHPTEEDDHDPRLSHRARPERPL